MSEMHSVEQDLKGLVKDWEYEMLCTRCLLRIAYDQVVGEGERELDGDTRMNVESLLFAARISLNNIYDEFHDRITEEPTEKEHRA
jgi:hypothetical protein